MLIWKENKNYKSEKDLLSEESTLIEQLTTLENENLKEVDFKVEVNRLERKIEDLERKLTNPKKIKRSQSEENQATHEINQFTSSFQLNFKEKGSNLKNSLECEELGRTMDGKLKNLEAQFEEVIANQK